MKTTNVLCKTIDRIHTSLLFFSRFGKPQMRIALSILVSCIIYDHPVTELGLIGMLLVFGAVFYRINRRMQGRKLLVWEGMDDSKGMDMFHEWHEHLDL